MRLVTYSWITVVTAVSFAAIGWFGLAGWMAAAVVIASIAMHVAGNAIGTRLRDSSDKQRALHESVPHPIPIPPPSAPTRLERHERLGSLVPISASIGATIGGLTGSLMLIFATGSSAAGAILGGLSSAIIGGLFGFLMASFVEILRTSLRDAIAADHPPTQTRSSGHP